jgi:hypothetical protein
MATPILQTVSPAAVLAATKEDSSPRGDDMCCFLVLDSVTEGTGSMTNPFLSARSLACLAYALCLDACALMLSAW